MTEARIDIFEARPPDDAAFLAAWDDAGRGARLHRALRPDVSPRYVAVGGEEGGRYEVVHEAGDVDGPGGVVVIELHEPAAGDDERFLAAWRAHHDTLARSQGHLGARLLRALGPAEFRFVALERWSSPLMVHRAAAGRLVYEVLRG